MSGGGDPADGADHVEGVDREILSGSAVVTPNCVLSYEDAKIIREIPKSVLSIKCQNMDE